MTEHHFATLHPVSLYAEIGKGSVTVHAVDTTESRVEVRGRDAEGVRVEQDGDDLVVIAPRQRTGFLSAGDASLDFVITVPTGSNLAVKSGSADVRGHGRYDTCQVRCGSGDVAIDVVGAATLETGSGDVRVAQTDQDVRVKSGSGDVVITRAAAALSVSTGSGDIEIGSSHGPTIVKTGSGDVTVTESSDDVSLSTGSGDLRIGVARRGRVTVKGASSDVHIGVPAGLPVWTDITTLTGRLHSGITSAGQPEEGADHLEVRATTVSGDVVLVPA